MNTFKPNWFGKTTARSGNPALAPTRWRAIQLAIASCAAGTGSLCGQAYFDTRNPFTEPVAPQPPPAPEAMRAGDDFRAAERVPYRPAGFDEGNYNLKLGPVLATFGASVSFAYNSNALQSSAGGDNYDFSINPSLNTNLRWQITDNARLGLNFGIGYRFNLVQEDLNSLTISPNTSIDYAFSVGDVLFTVFNRISSANDASRRADIIGTGNALSVRFNRINNSSGLSTEWAPYTDLSVSADYTFSLERGFDDSYSMLNGQSQTVSTALFYRLHPDLTVGISASASLNDYASNFQNSSKSYGVGPTATWRVSEAISVNASVRYTMINSERDGQIQDSSDFSGISGSLSVRHQLTQFVSHSLSLGRSVNGSLGSNFQVSMEAGYQLSWRITDFLPINFSASVDQAEQSGGLAIFAAPPGSIYFPPDPANGIPGILVTPIDTFSGVVLTPGGLFGVPVPGQTTLSYRFGVSTSYQITQKLGSSLGWNYTIRDSDFVLGDYDAHTVTLTLNYAF